jgi:3-hydroxybutyryl-CoA dehydrogenase
MKLLIIGDDNNYSEAQKKFGATHNYTHAKDPLNLERQCDDCDVVFVFNPQERAQALSIFFSVGKPVFLNACNISLHELLKGKRDKIKSVLFGFNGMRTLLDRPILEVSLMEKSQEKELDNVCKKLGTLFLRVDDRVGMVTSRVIAMIINEAYYTVQEGTATREDIDVAMKLGTNYPFGPFEWCNRIGIQQVYELLSALYEDTRDERYKICPLLKKEYLRC